MNRLAKMRILNDNFRTTLAENAYMSRDFFALPQWFRHRVLRQIREYDCFAPNGAHDAGLIITNDHVVQWRIECRTFNGARPDACDTANTYRVLLIDLLR